MIRFRKLLRKLILSAVSLGLFFVAAEIVARALEPGPFSILDHYPYVGDYHSADKRHNPGFEGRWDATWYGINARGMRGPEINPTFDNEEFRVVCVGDSCTLGKGVVESKTWPRLLEGKLQEAFMEGGQNLRPLVANLGVNGADGKVYRDLFGEMGVELKPHLVVIGYNLNDFPNSMREIDIKVYTESPLRRLMPDNFRDSMNRSALYRFARATYYEMRRARDWKTAEGLAGRAASEPINSPVWVEQKGFLKDIRDRVAAQGGRTMVLLFPYESQLYLTNFDTTAIDRLNTLCEELDLPFVDLAQSFLNDSKVTGETYFLRGDRYHPNPRGYEVVAQAVMDKLKERSWLPSTSK
jgi:lysophospholipase L1-like esterase